MKKIFKKLLYLGCAILLSSPFLVSAQGPKSVDDVWKLVNDIFHLLFIGIMFAAVVYIVLAAYTYLTASGDPKKVEKANQMLLYAVIGVAVAVLAEYIPYIAADIVGINLDDILDRYIQY